MLHRRSLLAPIVAAVVAACIAGCSIVTPASDPVVDGWPIGAAASCSDVARCEALVAVGLAGLDDRDPGHAEVASWALHDEGTLVDPATGDRILRTRSGSCCSVLVITLADGATEAIGVGYPGISHTPMAFPWGP